METFSLYYGILATSFEVISVYFLGRAVILISLLLCLRFSFSFYFFSLLLVYFVSFPILKHRME